MENKNLMVKVFYCVKPLIPRRFQLWLRRIWLRYKRSTVKDWPIQESAGRTPEGWTGWPEQKKFAFVLTHDVEHTRGMEKSWDLMKIEEELGFISSYNFVPERYDVSPELRKHLVDHGFEVGVHGLNHDGKLYQSKQVFMERAEKINGYIEDWDAVGFRSPAMHHNLEWIHALNIEYDASTFDTDPFEPQSDGVGTIFPFWVPGPDGQSGYVELPYTLPQDFTPMILMREMNIDIWKNKLDWIVEHGGMALINIHPDYIDFSGGKPGFEEFSIGFYTELLNYVKTKYKDQYWHALPKDVARYMRSQRDLPLTKSSKTKKVRMS